MNASVYTSPEGQRIIETAYRAHLDSELAASLTQRTIETELGPTFVLEKSSPGKPPLVLLHGSVSNSASWLGVIPLFARDFSVYCLDIPGEPGLSTMKRFPLNSEAPERWLKSALYALGLEKPFFIGMSLGGWYAVNFAVHNPTQVWALSLISAGGIGPQKSSFLFKAIFFMLLGNWGQTLLNKAIYHKVVMPREILDYQAIVSRHFRPVTEALPIFSDDQLSKLKMPVQFFGGDSDALLDMKKAVTRLNALLPHAEANLLEDTGHAIIDRFEAVMGFLLVNLTSK